MAGLLAVLVLVVLYVASAAAGHLVFDAWTNGTRSGRLYLRLVNGMGRRHTDRR